MLLFWLEKLPYQLKILFRFLSKWSDVKSNHIIFKCLFRLKVVVTLLFRWSEKNPPGIHLATGQVAGAHLTIKKFGFAATIKKPIELARHCQNLEDELDVVKKEILKILSEKSKCSKENEQLKKVLMSSEQQQQISLTAVQETNNNNNNTNNNTNNNNSSLGPIL